MGKPHISIVNSHKSKPHILYNIYGVNPLLFCARLAYNIRRQEDSTKPPDRRPLRRRKDEKMTNLEIYDAAHGITRDASGVASPVSPVGDWWNAGLEPMPIYSIAGVLYCCEGWNGETFKAFCVLDRYTIDEAHPDPVTLRPIYRFEDENREFDEDDDTAGEIVGFDVGSY